MSAANHKYFFEETTLTLVRKAILLRSDFIGIPSRLTRPALTPYATFSALTPYKSSKTRDPKYFLLDLSSFISSTFCMTTLVQTIPSCEIVIVLCVTLKSRVCICTLISDGGSTALLTAYTVCTKHLWWIEIELWAVLKTSRACTLPWDTNILPAVQLFVLASCLVPFASMGTHGQLALLLAIFGLIDALQPGIQTWWLRSCQHFRFKKCFLVILVTGKSRVLGHPLSMLMTLFRIWYPNKAFLNERD